MRETQRCVTLWLTRWTGLWEPFQCSPLCSVRGLCREEVSHRFSHHPIILMMVHSSCLFLLGVFLGLVTSHLVCSGLHLLTTSDNISVSVCLEITLSYLLLSHSLLSLICPNSSTLSTSLKVVQHRSQVLPGANICSAKLFLFNTISCQFFQQSYRRAEKPEMTNDPALQKMPKRKASEEVSDSATNTCIIQRGLCHLCLCQDFWKTWIPRGSCPFRMACF